MTKEQLERANELSRSRDFTQKAIAGLELAKESQKENMFILSESGKLQLFIKAKSRYDLDNSALEAVLDTLIKVHEEKLKQIEKEFNEL
jgi:hypothetical protein